MFTSDAAVAAKEGFDLTRRIAERAQCLGGAAREHTGAGAGALIHINGDVRFPNCVRAAKPAVSALGGRR
jgi:hypothetical protein